MNTFRKLVVYISAALSMTLSAAAQDIITTVAGGGPNGIPGVTAELYNPFTEAIDAQGNIYITSAAQNRVYKLSTAGIITLIAGTGVPGYSGDGGAAANAQLNSPYGVAVDGGNPANVYIGDFGNCLVRRVSQSTGLISTVAGLVNHPTTGAPTVSCGYTGDGGAADAAELYGAAGVAVNPHNGDLYVVDFYEGRVRRVAGGIATGTITTVAGGGGSTSAGNNCQGTAPYGDGGAANLSYLCSPQAIALDTSVTPANVFITETGNNQCTVREVVGATGDIYRIAGSYTLGCGFTDNVIATSAQLNDPWQPHVSVNGSTTTVTVADYSNARIRQFPLTYSAAHVPQPGTILTIAGHGAGGYCGDNGPALSACMDPVGVVFDAAGDIYIGDYGTERIREINHTTGYINTVVGWGPNGGTSYYYSDPIGLTGSPLATGLSLYQPYHVYADPLSTHVLIAAYGSQAIYEFNSSTDGVRDFAGNGAAGYAGDGTAADGPGTQVNAPTGVAKDSSGNIYISDQNNCAIREVSSSTGDITTIAGGSAGHLNGCGGAGDNGTAVNAQLYYPEGLAVDSNNNLYISEYGNCDIRKIVLSTGIISTVAGNRTCGYAGDGGPAVTAELNHPYDVAVDGAGDLYIADYNNARIRRVDAVTHNIATVAGDGTVGYSGDGLAVSNSLYYPQGIAVDTNGNLFIADYYSNIIRWVEPAGQMLTFAGIPPGTTGNNGFGGDGGLATKASFAQPSGVAQDAAGNFYVADYTNGRIRKITPFAGLGRSTASLTFENQPVGTTSDFQGVTLSAVGPTTISGISVSSGFTEIDDCAGQTLSAGQNCEVDVYFAPTHAGATSGTLTISENAFFASTPRTVSLSGTGAGLTVTGVLLFPAQLINTSSSQSITVNNSGPAITIHKISFTSPLYYRISGGSCPVNGGALASGSSCTVTVTFDPTSIGFKQDTLVMSSTDSESPLLVRATGIGSEVKLSSTSLAFGSIPDRNTSTLNLTITNTAASGTLTLSPAISGAGASAYNVLSTGNTCTSGVTGGRSCTLPVRFAPSADGSFAATLTLTTNGGSNPVISLTGTSTTDISLSAASISFATITHGTSETSNLTIRNLGGATLSVTPSFSGAGAAAFSISSTGNTCGSAIAGGGSCTLPVRFAPAAAQSYSATLLLTSNGGSNPTVSLTGTGH